MIRFIQERINDDNLAEAIPSSNFSDPFPVFVSSEHWATSGCQRQLLFQKTPVKGNPACSKGPGQSAGTLKADELSAGHCKGRTGGAGPAPRAAAASLRRKNVACAPKRPPPHPPRLACTDESP